MKHEESMVVVHYLGGRLLKGYAFDFNSERDWFLLYPGKELVDGKEIFFHELKAVFFVKSFEGNPDHRSPEVSEENLKNLSGMKLKVCFSDGECIYATTRGYSPASKGFFILPLDPQDNNSCIYVVKNATVSVEMIR